MRVLKTSKMRALSFRKSMKNLSGKNRRTKHVGPRATR